MSKLFLSILNMSIAASWIVLAVLALRFLLKKAPKWITVLLWAVVAIRLICPFTIESKVSLIPSAQTVSPGIMMDTVPHIYTGIPSVNNSINPIIGETFAPDPGDSINPLQVWIPVAAVLWGIGILALTVYGIISYLRIKKKISTAVLLCDNIFQSENVVSPFVLGFIRPKIYLPFSITGAEMLHVVAHEEAHIRRKDHWWKPLGFAILALHWFNPLMWIAYVLLCRDIELACDERVVKDLSVEERADYSQALLHCSVGRRMIASCPLAFGEVGVKDRVKSVLSYKKPAFWILVIGVAASIVLAVCFLTNPKPGELGTLENLEFISLTGRVENTTCVWVSDGFSYERVGSISEDLIRELASLKTSKEEISLNRSEDRDRSHTIVLQTEKQAEPSPNSYLEGLYIHFNSDFTSVWINNNVKPTLTYKVIEPQRAKEIYSLIASYKIVGSIAVSTGYIESIEPLKEKYPMYFDLDATNGLDIYSMPVLDDYPVFIILPGRAEAYTWEEVHALFKEATTIEEMRAIAVHYVLTQGVAREDIRILTAPIVNIETSNGLADNEAYVNKMLEEQFWEPLLIKPAPERYTGTMIDEVYYDIDGDGRKEYCVLHNGPTSGLFTFTFSVFEDGALEYFNVFQTQHSKLRFVLGVLSSRREGQLLLEGEGLNDTFTMTPTIVDGNIVLSCDEQEVQYWGEQGLDSPFTVNNTSIERSHNEVFSLEDFSNITVEKSKEVVLYSIDPQCAGYQTAYGVVYEFPLDDGRYLRAICRGGIIQSLDFHDASFMTGNMVFSDNTQDIDDWSKQEPTVQVPTISSNATDIEHLKAKFPEYFDLGTFKGLEVYIWQLAETSYSCGVLQGLNRNYSQKEIWALHQNPASLEEMRAIIAYYLDEGLAVREDITLVPVSMPHSSYAYIIDDAYKAKLNELFWSDATATYTAPLSFIMDEGIFDIDGDGKEEHCFMGYGPTSGIFTFSIMVFENGEPEYFNIFTCPWTTLRFEITEEGQGILARKDTNEATYLTMAIDDGNIVIYSDAQDVLYWGEQGLDSPFASLWVTKPEEGVFDSGPLKTIQGNFRTYYQNTDGTYQYNGYIYKYRLVITGRMPNAKADTTYVYLSNIKDISFERAMWASGLSSSLEVYFSPEEAILVEISTETPSDQTPHIKIARNSFLCTYTVYDQGGNVLYRIECTSRVPEIWEVSPGVYGLVTQTGTGRSTNWAVFCDVEKGLVSDTFHYVLDAQGPYVLCGEYKDQKHSVCLQNIFSPTEAEYRIPLDDASPKVADCIKAGTFTDENTVLITYCVGAVSPTPTEKSFPIAPNRNP